MKKFAIMVIALAMLVLMTGVVMADTGVNATFETQGVSVVTSVQAEGSMFSATDVTWKQSSAVPLTSIPPAPTAGTYYVSTYSEDTMSNGVGQIAYGKNTQLESKAGLNGQYNIEATKEIQFAGYNGAQIASVDNIYLDGTGTSAKTKNVAICVFAPATSETIPAFCNRVEAGSSVTGQKVSVVTETNDLFVVPSADTPISLNHDVRVTDTIGKASAYMEGIVMESRGVATQPYAIIEFAEKTSVDGYITLFDKDMQYDSGIRRVRSA